MGKVFKSNNSMQVQAPVLFLIFNRPDTTKEVFEAIRRARPTRLYVAADGPRLSRFNEHLIVENVRQIATEVDWPCDVRTLFREKNLGCKIAVSEAIDWFFENEEHGIILEDDCLPSPEFFAFCNEMLFNYRKDFSVGMISGCNPVGAGIKSDLYFMSRNFSIWGWATWRDRWCKYDINMPGWPSKDVVQKVKKNTTVKEFLYHKLSFDLTKSGILSTWDCQWTYCLIINNFTTIKPQANLIKNIGTIGAHANGESKNNNLEFGGFETGNLKFEKNYGLVQDREFYKYFAPGFFEILFKIFLLKWSLYKNIKNIYLSLKGF